MQVQRKAKRKRKRKPVRQGDQLLGEVISRRARGHQGIDHDILVEMRACDLGFKYVRIYQT
jgi:hypothetical protein